MKRLFLIILLFVGLLIVVSYLGMPYFVKADAIDTVTLQNPIKAETFQGLINALLDFIWKIALVATPVMIVIGGIIMVVSAGNPEQVKTGKNTVIWALAGFALIILARGLFDFIKMVIGITK